MKKPITEPRAMGHPEARKSALVGQMFLILLLTACAFSVCSTL